MHILLNYFFQGSLSVLLRNPKYISFTWEDPLLKMAMDIARGVRYLADNDIVHRDLKADNVLVTPTFRCKITDFGTGKVLMDRETRTQCGTLQFIAPEIIRGEKYGLACDVFSYGVVLAEIATKEVPYTGRYDDGQSLMRAVVMENVRPILPDDLDRDIAKLAEDCWQFDPLTRPDWDEILDRLQLILAKQLEGKHDKQRRARRVNHKQNDEESSVVKPSIKYSDRTLHLTPMAIAQQQHSDA